ncbi:MAG: phage holin family protein [Dermatophilaceae bacterium]|jgi:fatty acid desaturase|nr:phage holin family protein [Actinomycetales bacterium]
MAIDTSRPIADELTIGQLVASATRDVSTIVRAEIDLAKAEISEGVKHGGKGAGMFAGAAFFGLFGLGFLLTALAWGLVALGLPTWAGFLIVAVLLFVGAAIFALIGKKALAKAKPVPEKAIASTQETIATIKGQF